VPDAILPNGTSNLIFNLSGFEHREYSDDDYSVSMPLRTRWFSGIRDAAIVVGPTVCTRVVGVRFKPAGVGAFLGVPATEVCRFTVAADELWGRECELLHERLFQQPDMAGRFRLLQEWLLERFVPQPREAGLVRCVEHMRQAHGNVAMDDLAGGANLSVRQFRRRFEAVVGLTPKRLARILRFQRLIERLGIGGTADWTGLAFDCGYYDQSHLIADFREFAGVTPRGYLSRSPVVPGFLPVDPARMPLRSYVRR